jgi:eukaryotic-like serine/threonine-protein kinase
VLRAGERIGDWIVEKPLGEGGMGAVYRVHSALTQRLVAALKVMKPSAEPDARARFIREAEALAALRHYAVVRVMEFAEDDARGLVYLVMELAVGETLRHRFNRGPMELREALGIFTPLARGLEHAHGAGVFHRDIKPSNIILCEDGTVRLVDFGIAAAHNAEPLTNTGQLGTLAYLPPEVFKAERAEPHSVDVYAFGLLVHESLTGERSFPVDPSLTPAAAAAAVGVRKLQTAAMELPERFPERLRELVRRATAPDPAARPSMREVRSTLETLVERRASAEAGPSARLVPLPPVGAPNDEHTMRVPDPTDKPVAGPRGVPRRLMVIGGLAALVLGGAAALVVARAPERQPTTAAAAEKTSGSATAPRAVVPVPAKPAPLRSPSPAASLVPSVAPSPSSAATAPSASPSPAASLASPSPAASSRPRLWVSPSPPSAGDDDAGAETGDGSEPVDTPGAVAGRWDLTHEAESTGRAAGYRLTLQQDGNRVSGRGRKYTEDGVLLPAEQRTPIRVDGQIDGQYLVLNFVEQGAWGSSSGTIRWLIAPGSLQGRFASDAEDGGGTSVARRVR